MDPGGHRAIPARPALSFRGWLSVLAAAAWAIPAQAAEPGSRDPPLTAPRDPNEATPFMAPPNGQPRTDQQRWDPPTVTGRSSRRRIQLSVAPSFASFFGSRFLGRPDAPTRGGGAAIEADIRLVEPVWLRLSLAHSVHPVQDEYALDDSDKPVQTAAKGNIQATHAGLGVAYGLDLGRVMPLIDVGVGALWIRSPPAVQDGQLGGACMDTGACDTGLVCGAENTCRVGTTPAAHAGLAVDVLLGDRWTVGAGLRYFALISAPGTFPVYLTASVRLGTRF